LIIHQSETIRIANDLNRNIVNFLGKIKQHAAAIEKEIRELEKLNVSKYFSRLVDQAEKEATRLYTNPIPEVLSQKGLGPALTDLFDAQSRNDLAMHSEIKLIELSEEESTMLYRIVRDSIEILGNESDCTQIEVVLFQDALGIHLNITSNTIRFDENSLTYKGQSTLKSIKSRVKYLKGSISILNEVNTRFLITI